ncbi:hypothetical protein ABZS66_17020 [Dactylosporangium sp. NPDC005572]|uniref:hypothetical protein n=1 Tax=Dactylosporangium sp. NPDC005572 TaxID=3156889 RepID=UPI0033A41F0B
MPAATIRPGRSAGDHQPDEQTGRAEHHGEPDSLPLGGPGRRQGALDLGYRQHDVGKAGCDWQLKLQAVGGTDQPVGIDHKALGCRIASERGLGRLAVAIYGHHGGLIDVSGLGLAVMDRMAKYQGNAASAELVLSQLLPDFAGADKSFALFKRRVGIREGFR